jgi:hypothetical protein
MQERDREMQERDREMQERDRERERERAANAEKFAQYDILIAKLLAGTESTEAATSPAAPSPVGPLFFQPEPPPESGSTDEPTEGSRDEHLVVEDELPREESSDSKTRPTI